MMGRFWAFPGQGSQSPGMGRRLAQRFDSVVAFLDDAEARSGFELRRIMWDLPAEVLRRTENAQPAIVAFSLAALHAWRPSRPGNASPVWASGHSVGALAAAAAAGVMEPYEAIMLARFRGEIMSAAPGDGSMLAVAVSTPSSRHDVSALAIGLELDIACVNGPKQVVLSGHREAIELAKQALGARSIPLDVSHAFHSRLMDAVLPEWSNVLARTPFADPDRPYLSGRTGQVIATAEGVREDLKLGIREPVRWDLVSHDAAACQGGEVFGSGRALQRMWRGTSFAGALDVIDDDFREDGHV